MAKNIAGNKPKPLLFKDTISSPYDSGDQLPVLDEKISSQIVEELTLAYQDDISIKMKKKELSSSLHRDILALQKVLNSLYIKDKKCIAAIKKRKKELNDATVSTSDTPAIDAAIASDSLIKERQNELQQIRSEMKPVKEKMTTLTKAKKLKVKQLDEQLCKDRKSASLDPFIIKGVNEITKAMEKTPLHNTYRSQKKQQLQQQQVNYDIKVIIMCTQLTSQGGNVMIEHLPMMATMRNIPFVILPSSVYGQLRSALGIKSLMAIAIQTPATKTTPPTLTKLLQLAIDAYSSSKKQQFPLVGIPTKTTTSSPSAINLKPVKILKEGNKRKKIT